MIWIKDNFWFFFLDIKILTSNFWDITSEIKSDASVDLMKHNPLEQYTLQLTNDLCLVSFHPSHWCIHIPPKCFYRNQQAIVVQELCIPIPKKLWHQPFFIIIWMWSIYRYTRIIKRKSSHCHVYLMPPFFCFVMQHW